MNNVLAYDRNWRYYLRHPICFLQETVWNLRAAYSRATKGYAAVDVWELGPRLLEILPPMLRYLEKYHYGVPCDMTDEEWTQWLHDMADSIEHLQEENWEKQNEYADEFYRTIDEKRIEKRDERGVLTITWSDEPDEKEISEKYFARCEELNKQWYVRAEEVGKSFFKAIPKLWD